MSKRLELAISCKPIMCHEQFTVYATDAGWCVADSDAYNRGVQADEIVYEHLGLLSMLKSNGYDKHGVKGGEDVTESETVVVKTETESVGVGEDTPLQPIPSPYAALTPYTDDKPVVKKSAPKKAEPKKYTKKQLEGMKLKDLRNIAKPMGLKGTSVKQLAGLIFKAQ